MQTICLKTNQHKLISNLRHAFTQESMLGELLQNARRAKASSIRITAIDNTLTVSDDGVGISDLQSLIFIAESGWNQALQTSENCFGLGVLSTLYFAEHLSVHSGDRAFDAPTASIIRGESLEVYARPRRSGTQIQLDGVQAPQTHFSLAHWVRAQLNRLCEAFPVPVFFNGVEMARPLSDEYAYWHETLMGRVLINLSGHPNNFRCFLQGLPIEERFVSPNYQVIMLSDHTQARLPDRQHLLNGVEDYERIKAAIREAYRRSLIDTKRQLGECEFVERYAERCFDSKNADLLNDVTFAPRKWFRDWENNPAGYWRSFERSYPEGVITRAEIEKVGVWSIVPNKPDALAAETYLNARNAFLLEENKLDDNHWLKQIIMTLAGDEIKVRHTEVLHQQEDLSLMEDVSALLVDGLFVSLEDEPGEFAVKAVRKDNTLYLTSAAQSLTRLIADYIDVNERFDEARSYEDEQSLLTFMTIGCSRDPSSVIYALLPNSIRYSSQSKLAGVTAQLVFDDSGKLQKVIA